MTGILKFKHSSEIGGLPESLDTRPCGFCRRFLRALLSPVSPRLVFAIHDEIKRKLGLYQLSQIPTKGRDVRISPSTMICSPSHLALGDECVLNDYVTILARGGVTMGSGVWVAAHAALISTTHPADVEYIGEHPMIDKPIVIEDNVWIGSHAVVLPGVRLGRSCIVAAGAVVTKDVPPYAIVTGSPARVQRYKSIAAETTSVSR